MKHRPQSLSTVVVARGRHLGFCNDCSGVSTDSIDKAHKDLCNRTINDKDGHHWPYKVHLTSAKAGQDKVSRPKREGQSPVE